MDIYFYDELKTDYIYLPVVPREVLVNSPQKIETFSAIGIGDLNIIGVKGNRSLTVSSFFPVKDYTFLKGRRLKGMEYVQKLEEWRNTKRPLNITVTQLNVRMLCVVSDFEYGIKDGSGDIYYTLNVTEYVLPDVKKVTPQTKIKTAPAEIEYNKNTYGVVVSDVLFVRSGPWVGYAEVGQLKKGDRVRVLEAGKDWWKIIHGNNVAFVYAETQQIKKV